MTHTATRSDWLIFLALGFMWGSSYLFIKLAVDSFGTFTLISLRLLIGGALLWVVLRLSGVPLPHERRAYGHLLVMAVINISIPFVLITWAEQSVDSALAAILNSTVPLMVIVLAPVFLHDEPIRINGLAGLAIGFAGVVLIVSPELAAATGTVPGQIALLGSSLSYGIGNVYARRNVRGLHPMIPAVFQVTFALLIVGTLALVVERPWETAHPDAEALFSVVWLGILGSGFAYLAYFRLLSRLGATRTSLVAYLLPVVGIVLGFLVRHEPINATLIAGTALVIGGVALVNGRWGRRRLFAPTPPVEAA
ncbi:MAG TPA: EamA family transporter [Candidatus Limnocylindrales bacterium]|jgi:drug/metabolite transporter (DMT)-like permease|nr:EamA family transporter [Candidatus Limnocylindrales bacterium]